MNILDGIMILLTVVLLVRGLMVGFVRQLAFVFALVLGYLLAGRYHGLVSPALASLIGNAGLRFLVAYGLTFLAVYLAVMLLGVGLRKVMQVTFLSWFDRLLGGLLGAGKAVFVGTLLYMGLAVFLSGTSPVFTDSLCAPWLRHSAEFLTQVLQDQEARNRLLPRPPAIVPPGMVSEPPVEPSQVLRRDAAGISQ